MQSAIMVMGVSGCGKSTIGAGLAHALGGVFLDGDDYHPKANVDHMAARNPHPDDMRWPCLDRLATAVNAHRLQTTTVFACSALRQSYRDHLCAAIPDLKIAYLDAPYAVVAARLRKRTGHYMPAHLLDSQFVTLEVPASPTISVSTDQPIDNIIDALSRIF
jgi:carbohydrate kinase (thermoresistant glucokinase family)